MDKKLVSIILAAGKSQRAGLSYSKLLHVLEGKTVFQKTFETFLAIEGCDTFVLVLPENDRDKFEALIKTSLKNSNREGLNLIIIQGGATRRLSVKNALDSLSEYESENTYALVHDAARCFVSKKLIEKVIEACFLKNAITPGVPVTNSLKKVNPEGKVLQSLNREEIWEVQTPQAFRLDLIQKVHREFNSEVEPTDDASMVEHVSTVYMIEGEVQNKKITFLSDLNSR